MNELEQLRAELASVTASAEEWRTQALAQDRHIARLTKKTEWLKQRIERGATEKAELQRELALLQRMRARVAELVGVLDAAEVG